MFVDRAEITIISGKGGNGAVTFRRDPYVPDGGPDGGDGGNGGSVIFVADKNLRTLMDLKYKRKYQAENGQPGMKRNRFGKKGQDLYIKVPVGTMIIDKETGHLMKDLVTDGDSVVAAKGGRGGRGNVHYKSSIRQAPNFAEAGGPAKTREVILELKLIADVGLLGFPNVGKSTLLSVCTNSKPKIAGYHFTTIDPNLGVVYLHDTSFVMADIAGIIEGASKGAGLGFKFLKHIERTKVLIHVVDVAGSEGRDPIEDYKKINSELREFDPRLAEKTQIVAANKIDLVTDKEKYQEFMDEGTLMVLEGTVLDMMDVYDDLENFMEDNRYNVLCVGFDPYNAREFVERWAKENGPYGVEKVIQGVKTESVPLGELKDMATDRILLFDESLMSYGSQQRPITYKIIDVMFLAYSIKFLE